MNKFIYLMELFTDPKESYFKQGLKQRIKLITLSANLDGLPSDIDIIMSRNTPDASREYAEIFSLYDGRISRKTLIENFADFVPDAELEMEQLKQEQGNIYDQGLEREPSENTESDRPDDSTEEQGA
jgi:hypothetical protein